MNKPEGEIGLMTKAMVLESSKTGIKFLLYQLCAHNVSKLQFPHLKLTRHWAWLTLGIRFIADVIKFSRWQTSQLTLGEQAQQGIYLFLTEKIFLSCCSSLLRFTEKIQALLSTHGGEIYPKNDNKNYKICHLLLQNIIVSIKIV